MPERNCGNGATYLNVDVYFSVVVSNERLKYLNPFDTDTVNKCMTQYLLPLSLVIKNFRV